MVRPFAALAIGAVSLALGGACKKVIGDSCNVSSDCSIQGDRTCDISQTGGYCTVVPCDPGTCPDNGVCVIFNAHASRFARNYCMAGCSQDSDCRSEYRCAHPDPANCVVTFANTPVLGPGQSCNIFADTPPQQPGWCVQGAR